MFQVCVKFYVQSDLFTILPSINALIIALNQIKFGAENAYVLTALLELLIFVPLAL